MRVAEAGRRWGKEILFFKEAQSTNKKPARNSQPLCASLLPPNGIRLFQICNFTEFHMVPPRAVIGPRGDDSQ
jgi:hypothetical protein